MDDDLAKLKKAAFSNALASVKKETQFPHNIFHQKWKDYLFFESYAMFDDCFIDVKNLLLREEEASVVALINLGNKTPTEYSDPQVMFIIGDTQAKEYNTFLRGDETATSWMFLMDRYVSASDKGNWAIYCEKENDIAVFAFNEKLSKQTCLLISALLQASPISVVDCSANSLRFDFNKPVASWQSTLKAEYLPRA